MEVSVIIPVFNAALFLESAVKSALREPQVSEVILIEDGSKDRSPALCKELEQKNRKVRFLKHPGGKNRGVSASRNLGIKQAKSEFICFLDADDYFLPGRFQVTEKVFRKNPVADAVYECVGTEFLAENDRVFWGERPVLTTMSHPVPPDEFFHKQRPIGTEGYICVGGWTLKRKLHSRVGLFPEALGYGEDTALFLKVALAGNCFPGELKRPVGIRRVHGSSATQKFRAPAVVLCERVGMWREAILWAGDNGYSRQAGIMVNRMINQLCWPRPSDTLSTIEKLRITLGAFPRVCAYPSFYLGLWQVQRNRLKIALGKIRR
jgi:GT2 family glycosyltransferase